MAAYARSGSCLRASSLPRQWNAAAAEAADLRVGGMRPPDELMRRLRLGDIRKVLRDRYGPILPDDDAGREELLELLRPTSLHPNDPTIKMTNVIETMAPWMGKQETMELLDRMNRMPVYERKPSAKEIGRRLNVPNCRREALRLKTIAPADLDETELAERRKLRRRARDRERRRKKGVRPRVEYLAKSLSRQEPWLAEGISRRTWYRRQKAAPEAQYVLAQVCAQ
jgi:hypothetical protein